VTALTIILPHLRNPGNDRSLAIALDCIFANTRNDFDLLVATEKRPLAGLVNEMIASARTDCVVYTASDTFFARGWDEPMLALWNADTLVTNVLVEPGAIGMHPDNVHKDFGRKPETFRRADFEAWVASGDAPVPNNFGWYAPFMISRAAFLEQGGYLTDLTQDHRGFTAADQLLFADWQARGKRIMRARSYAYHLQGWSDLDEQQHEKRELQAL
jgi:hypothetical protein